MKQLEGAATVILQKSTTYSRSKVKSTTHFRLRQQWKFRGKNVVVGEKEAVCGEGDGACHFARRSGVLSAEATRLSGTASKALTEKPYDTMDLHNIFAIHTRS